MRLIVLTNIVYKTSAIVGGWCDIPSRNLVMLLVYLK